MDVLGALASWGALSHCTHASKVCLSGRRHGIEIVALFKGHEKEDVNDESLWLCTGHFEVSVSAVLFLSGGK